MPLPTQISLNSVMITGLGVILIAVGFYLAFSPLGRMLAAGLVFTGTGCVFSGLTNGFADPTPQGLRFRKLGLAAFIVGVPILALGLFYLLWKSK
jgi:hypothetical protein